MALLDGPGQEVLRGGGNRHEGVLVRRVFTGGSWNIYG